MGERANFPRTDRKLHRIPERRNRKVAIVAGLVVIVVAAVLIASRYIEVEEPTPPPAAPADEKEVEEVAPPVMAARLVRRQGMVTRPGKDYRLDLGIWLLGGEAVETDAGGAAGLRTDSGALLDVAPRTLLGLDDATRVALKRGVVAVDRRKCRSDSPFTISMGRGNVVLEVERGALAIIFHAPQSRLLTIRGDDGAEPAAHASTSIHCWAGSVSQIGAGEKAPLVIEQGHSMTLVTADDARPDAGEPVARLTLDWSSVERASEGAVRLALPGEPETTVDVAKRRSLAPALRLLTRDLAEQVEAIATGERLDVDLHLLLEERGLIENGLALRGASAAGADAVVSFVDGAGDEIVNSALTRILESLDERWQPRAHRIIAERVHAMPGAKPGQDHKLILLRQEALFAQFGTWIEIPEKFAAASVLVRREALANKGILLEVIADHIDCSFSETEWGYVFKER